MRIRRLRPSLPAVILGLGLAAAAASGWAAWRAAGPYGDGPFGAGFRRIHDPSTGRHLLAYDFPAAESPVRAIVDESSGRFTELRYDPDADGSADLRVHVEADGRLRVEQDLDADGVVDRWQYYADLAKLERGEAERIGFSTAGDGVVDAWRILGDGGPTGRVEVSTGRDGRVDRWEDYEDGLLVRVEEDTDGDGSADAWSTYRDGILAATSRSPGAGAAGLSPR